MQARFLKMLRELREIGDYIAGDNPTCADSFVDELLQRCLSLARHLERNPTAVLVLGRELRRCPFGGDIIFYHVGPKAIEIAHVFHSARDYMRLLFPEE
jgi:toxin ParE1/3/4